LDDRGLLKIADFGLALPADAQTQLTQTGMFVGTPGYLAPEQVSGEKADNRTDIYALGVTFYLLLTGTPPFRGDSPLALVKQIIDSEPADVSTLNPSVDAETRRILGKMIAKDRAQRYQSCHELVSDLEEYLATRGVRSMTAGLATRVPSSSPELAAAASAPTQNISRQEAQSAPTIIQSPLASPVTQPDMPPARRSSAVTILVVAVVLLMLIGGGIGAAVFGTRMFRNWQQHKSEETAAKQPEPPPATATATATPPAATAHEGVLLSDAVKLPAATTDSSAAQPAVVAPAPAPVPVAVSAPKQTPLAAEKPAVRARAGVVIAATGDPQLLGAVSEVLRSEMRSAGIDVVDAQTLPATEDLLRGGGVSAGRLIDGLSGERYAVLLLARVEPTGQRELSYYGRHDIAYSSRVTLTAYDLATGKPFGSSPSATIEYTSLNAQDKSEEAVGPLAQEIAGTIRAH
ncbi:MAG TPA: serine/threonine-protein kinase, partial [Thermoanaerobaculia bacterium]|nr:serine/threonine-protein kinase [Thermoanaerobaculia bacterium]